MDEEQANEIALRKETLAAERQRMRQAVQQKYRVIAAAAPKFTGVEFGLWLGAAIIADLLSLIPYVGLIVSYPFMFFFWLFKMMKGLNWKKSTLTIGGSAAGETLLSPLPMCIAAVFITYGFDKATALAKKATSRIPVARKLGEALLKT